MFMRIIYIFLFQIFSYLNTFFDFVLFAVNKHATGRVCILVVVQFFERSSVARLHMTGTVLIV